MLLSGINAKIPENRSMEYLLNKGGPIAFNNNNNYNNGVAISMYKKK